MQLEFFGENFDRAKCKSTCDNCQAGREPERRDMTTNAKAIIRLLTDASNQKKGYGGVTMVQLSDLYKGSKSQSATKSLTTARLTGYGAGSKLQKHEIERITHAMIFERLLVETSTENKGGFTSDYVSLGENSNAVQNGQRQFFVEFPTEGATGKENKAGKSSTKQKSRSASSSKKTSVKNLGPSTASGNGVGQETEEEGGGLQFTEVGDISDDEDDTKTASRASKSGDRSVLPYNHTKDLVETMKKMIHIWADYERNFDNNVFCK
jgi:superfamily II DNA helicase RecQ